jgi:hypothetical protein
MCGVVSIILFEEATSFDITVRLPCYCQYTGFWEIIFSAPDMMPCLREHMGKHFAGPIDLSSLRLYIAPELAKEEACQGTGLGCGNKKPITDYE